MNYPPKLLFLLQVWEWDPEEDRKVLLIDADPMMLVNDPQLTNIIETLHGQDGYGGGRVKSASREVIESIGYIIVKLCEILIEIFL